MTSQRPAAQPKSVLRGHKAQVHSTTFIRDNQRLASGDAEGFVVLWDLTIMRPRAVWRAHQGAILGIEGWGDDKIITHGRDNRLVVWKLGEGDEAALSTALPLDQSVSDRRQPWVLHILEVNTMNFCSFASCQANPDNPASDELLVAVPNTLSTESVDIYHLPTQTRRHTVKIESKGGQIGMVMALSLFWLEGFLTLVAAYENGLAMVARLGRNSESSWEVTYRAQSHRQPILSLDVPSNKAYFLTSGADAIIAKHPIPLPHAGLLAKPKNHDRFKPPHMPSPSSSSSPSILSSALAGDEPRSPSQQNQQQEASSPPPAPPLQTAPLKMVNTKHAGQQGLRIRSDGKIFATAGWDARVRVYSTKTLAELAVLKWHGVGCYAIAFAAVDGGGGGSGENEHAAGEDHKAEKGRSTPGEGVTLSKARAGGELSAKDQRLRQAREAHWLAAGSKDGKISLWDVY